MRYIAGRDHRLMRRVHNWLPPRWFRAWMVLSTRGGDGWLWYAMGAVVALFGGSSRTAALGAGAAAAAAAIGLYSCLKRAVGRKRPCDIEPHRWADLLPPDRFSFPSGHSMLAFAITVPLALFYPVASGILAFCALSVSASRILLGMHFLSDVVAGGVMGGLLGYAAYSFFS